MSLTDWLSPLLSFGGASLGAWLVYRAGRRQELGARFEAGIDLLASDQERQRALGRARIVELCRHGSIDSSSRREALQVLAADVHTSCPEPVRQKLSSAAGLGTAVPVRVADIDNPRVDADGVLVPRSLVTSAEAYVLVAGGPDAAPEQLIVLIAQAEEPGTEGATSGQDAAAEALVGRPLPADQRLLMIKLSADATTLTREELHERTRRAWRLSLARLQENPPCAVAAVAQQKVIGAWEYIDASPCADIPERIEFTLGAEKAELIGCEFHDRGQNPVRYWP